nr:hypothetical protein [Bacteroidales bacterium]
PGTFVDVWYRSSKRFNFDKESKSMLLEDSLKNAAEKKAELDSLAKLIDTIQPTETDFEENYEDEF